MKTLVFIITLLAVLPNFFNASANSFKKQDQLQKKMELKTLIESFAKGESFNTKNETYVLLPELFSYKTHTNVSKRTIVDTQETETDSLNLQNSTQSGFVARKGNFIIMRSSNEQMSTSKTLNTIGNSELYPVVLNQRTNQFGIVTREVVVELINVFNAEAISEEFKIELIRSFNNLRLAFYRIPANQDLMSIVQNLREDSRTKSVDLEVLENLNEPL